MNLNKQTITYSFIIIFIIITFIHLYKINNNNNNKENFMDIMESQNLQGFDVFINSMSQVKFGNNSNKISLDTMMNEKVSKTELNNSISNLTTTVGGLSTNITNLMNTPSIPDYTIIEYTGKTMPTGWQLCDGSSFKYANSNEVVKQSIGDSDIAVKTPNLNMIEIINNYKFWANNSYDEYRDSSFFSEYGWHSPSSGTDYMRLQLDKLFIIYGIVVAGRSDYTGDFTKTLEAYVSSVSFKSIDEISFITSPYAIVPNTTNIISTLCKVSNSSIISANPSWTATPKQIMFDTPIIGNVLTIKPLTSGRTYTGLRVAVVVGPINTFIIKQPKKI